jgi:RNA polymerase sigma-70 factor, ECF subfamily
MRSDIPPPRAGQDSGVEPTESAVAGHNGGMSAALVLPLRLAPRPSGPRSVVERTAAFRGMYDGHVDFVWRNLRRLGVSDADVEDRTQEVFVIAHRRFDEFEDRGHGPRAWLFQIVLRVASDARRHRRRHPEDPDGGAAELRGWTEPEQQVELDRREALTRLDEALSMIDVQRRAVLVLHEIEEMTAPEIATSLNIPLNTVYSRLRVARAELEQALVRRSREPPPVDLPDAAPRPSWFRLKGGR